MLGSRMLMLGGALIVAPLMAQTQPAPAVAEQPAAAAPAAASTAAPSPAASTAAVTVGAKVKDASGADVGTIEAVNGDIATLSTGTAKAGVPIASFARNGDGSLAFGMTKAQVEAQAATATKTATATTPATPAAALKFDVGVKVSDASGAQVGTIKAVNGNNVTVASATAAAQLPKSAFASGPDGLVIGLTPAQFEAAAKAAGGKTG